MCQLVYFNRLRPKGDPSLDLWPVIVCPEAAQSLSIVAACTIYLKPFIDSLESGFINLGDLRRQNVLGAEYGLGRRGYSDSRGTKISFSLGSLKTRISKPAHEAEHIELGSRNVEVGQSQENRN